MEQLTPKPTLELVTQPGTVNPHPASLSTEWDKWLPSTQTDWSLFQQTVNVIDAMTTDRTQLDEVLRLYDWWSIWNQLVFRSSLKPNFISVETADYGKWLGLCCMFPSRKIAISLAAYSHRHITNDDGIPHAEGTKSTRAKRPPQFEHLSNTNWNACCILLHEMMHDCLWASIGKHEHESGSWAQLCNMIGRDILGLPLLYAGMVNRRLTCRDDDGNVIMQPISNGKTDDDGNIVMVPKRKTVWESTYKGPVPDGMRKATEIELRCFPYLESDSYIAMHTITLTEGKLVAKNGGEPVVITPTF